MRVLILGGNGLIGSHILRFLAGSGFDLICVGRSVAAAKMRFPQAEWRRADIAAMTRAEQWGELLHGVDALVNCSGALQAGPDDDLQAIHVHAPKALFAAAAAAGVRVIQISAMGAAQGALTAFAATKGEGDAALASMGESLCWSILRPGLVLAPEAYGGSWLLRALAALPWVLPAPRFAPARYVAVEDIARTVQSLLRDRIEWRTIYDIAHPEAVTLTELLAKLRRAMGLAGGIRVPVPRAAARLLGWAADLAGLLGWRNPARSTLLRQYADGLPGDSAPWLAAIDWEPTSLDRYLAENPLMAETVWAARLYLLKPVVLLALSMLFVISGVVGLTVGLPAAIILLAGARFGSPAAEILLIGGSFADILAGLLVLFRPAARAGLSLMAVLSLAYLVTGTVWLPELWSDPLGPLLKIVPILALIGVAGAIMRNR